MHFEEPPRIAVLVDTATGWGRAILQGIANYANKHGPWHLWIEARGQNEPVRLGRGWEGEGVIARVATHASARHIAASELPVVNVSGIDLSGVELIRVANDMRAAGQMAAQYLLGLGLRRFGYVGPSRFSCFRHHQEAFATALARAGLGCEVFVSVRLKRDWIAGQHALIRWLKQFEKPVGILTWAMPQGLAVLDACRWGGMLVPEQVAVLSGDDDALLANICTPTLSGTSIAAQQAGYEAARVLDELIRTGKTHRQSTLIPPTGIVTRCSTNTLAIENKDVARAVAFIREHAWEPIQVDDVSAVVAMSRRHLERQFEETLQRTPAEEIRRVRLERAKALLKDSDLPIGKVATASGFGTAGYLMTVFKKDTGLTPLKYRKQLRGR